MRWQHLPSLKVAPDAAATALGVDSHDQLDLFGTWRFSDRWALRYGIDNLADAEPEWVGRTTTNNAMGSTNNLYGRFGRAETQVHTMLLRPVGEPELTVRSSARRGHLVSHT